MNLKWGLQITVIALILMLAACTQQSNNISENNGHIEDKAASAVEALKSQDMHVLSEMVDPNRGLLFSPYAYVDLDSDLIFTAAEVENLMSDATVYTWGSYDGTGDPIELTFKDYYDRFVYDQDYQNADEISYNEWLGQGNTINNISTAYPDATTVEYHFEGSNPDYAGMDWKSLRLVFMQSADKWHLIAIVHDEWTI